MSMEFFKRPENVNPSNLPSYSYVHGLAKGIGFGTTLTLSAVLGVKAALEGSSANSLALSAFGLAAAAGCIHNLTVDHLRSIETCCAHRPENNSINSSGPPAKDHS